MTEDGNVAKRREFECVEIPCLTDEERARYAFMTPEPTYNHLRVIEGEWQDDVGDSWFFARTEDNFIHKFPAPEVRRKRKDLVDEFEARGRSGNSSPFDPSSNNVHPDSRVRLKITIHKGARTSTSTTSDYVHASSSESDGEGFASSSEDSYDGPPDTSPRMSTRASSKKTKELPYSPRKSHPRRKFYTHGDDDDDASVHSTELGSVRMTRQRRLARNTSEDPLVISSDSPGSEEEEEEASTIKRIKGLPLARLGIVHAMKDRDWDPHAPTAPTRLHRHNCEKCGQGPLSEMKKPRRKRKLEEFEEDMDSLGGWLRCVSCPIVMHWGCTTSTRQTEIMKSINQTATATWQSERQADPASDAPAPRRRHDLDRHETTGFLCSWCSKSEVCMGCHRAISHGTGEEDETMRLLFRCNVCTRGAHYDHLPQPDDNNTLKLGELASYYQNDLGWKCHDCSSFVYQPDKIIAWRPYPAEATESSGSVDYSSSLPREYLLKWAERSYKRLQWVPHMWLLATHKQRLRKFVLEGRTVKLLEKVDQSVQGNDDVMLVDRAQESTPEEGIELPAKHPSLLGPVPDAERRINPAWRTVDRVLDVLLWKEPKKKLTIRLNQKPRRVESDDDNMDPRARAELDDAFNKGEQPSAEYTETIAEWEKRNKRNISQDQIGDVVWAFFKWGDLGYEEATWDSPPRSGEAGYTDYERAFTRFIAARAIPKPKGPTGLASRKRPKDHFMGHAKLEKDGVLDLGQDPKFKLMDFQVDGFNWLCNNWWNTQHCILADEMGLGKTVQIATFLGRIIESFNAFPALVVVPNSTITNWVREIERWAPRLKVVPFYGDGRARECIIRYELQKFHVIVASYEAFSQGQDFNRVFKKQPRWETLIVDEGQRLKNNDSTTFKKLRELNSIHRIIMTGTPLNNNIRELFNLMNFLDPDEWADLEQLEKDHQSESLDEERVKQLHERLRPYFLRRTKKEVLKLPPKNEVIVPLSMLPLQRDVYKSLYKGNTEVLRKLTPNSRVAASISSLRNILMQLRKCLQHPYLISSELEPENLSEHQAHERLIETSTKLLFLRQLLPPLKARGHRVLIFTQFSIALDILEEFLNGENIKWLRLDGSTAQRARQEGIDEFNKPGSDVLVYMLTTRAGGAGINLWTADTVIMFDPDFNPHQDLQAIARAHRFGQTKTVLVFKLVVTDSVEEKIMQIGRKKMALDHLIVQTMEDQEEGGTDVKSILTHGAQALFEGNQREIKYSEADIADLITKTEEAKEEMEETKEGAFSFSFAKVWTAERAALAEMEEEPVEEEEAFAETMAKIEMEREMDKATEVSGRGVRRKAARAVKSYGVDEEDAGKKGKGKQKPVSDDDFSASEDGSESDTTSEGEKEAEPTFEVPINKDWKMCGLCAQMHQPGDQCSMTESSEHLAQYRLILMTQSEHEPYEKRAKAIQSIEETLIRRGHIAKIRGQPLYLISPVEAVPRKTPKLSAPATTANGTSHASSSKVMNNNITPANTSNFNPDHNRCPICLRTPWHKMNKCPKVRAGPQSIASALARLQASPHADSGNTAAIINQLRLLLEFNESAVHPAVDPVAQVASQQHINTAGVPHSATLSVPGDSRHGPEPMQIDNDS